MEPQGWLLEEKRWDDLSVAPSTQTAGYEFGRKSCLGGGLYCVSFKNTLKSSDINAVCGIGKEIWFHVVGMDLLNQQGKHDYCRRPKDAGWIIRRQGIGPVFSGSWKVEDKRQQLTLFQDEELSGVDRLIRYTLWWAITEPKDGASDARGTIIVTVGPQHLVLS